MPNNFALPVTRSRGRAAVGPEQRTTWLRISLLTLFLLALFLLFRRPHVGHQTKEPAEVVALNAQFDAAVQHTEEMLRSMRADIEVLNKNLESAHKVLEQELRRVPPAGDTGATVARAAAPAPCNKDGERVWLTIGIPTIPRKNVDYLTTTLESLVDELPYDASDPMYGAIRVIVMNNKPGLHEPFERLRERLAARDPDDYFAVKGGPYLQLVDNPGTVLDPAPPDLPDPDDLHNPDDRPGREVRRQTCDLITLLGLAEPLSNYYLFMEDDFSTCLNAFRALHYALAKLNTVPALRRWLALRVSYGMNGVVLRNSDIGAFSSYLRNNTVRLPPDLLWLEWFQGKNGAEAAVDGRKLAVYKYNLFDHIGTVSSFAVRPDRPKWPGCFESMAKAWSLHLLERFPTRRCRHSDLSPCPPDDAPEAWTKQPITWPVEGAGHEPAKDHAPRARQAPQDGAMAKFANGRAPILRPLGDAQAMVQEAQQRAGEAGGGGQAHGAEHGQPVMKPPP